MGWKAVNRLHGKAGQERQEIGKEGKRSDRRQEIVPRKGRKD